MSKLYALVVALWCVCLYLKPKHLPLKSNIEACLLLYLLLLQLLQLMLELLSIKIIFIDSFIIPFPLLEETGLTGKK